LAIGVAVIGVVVIGVVVFGLWCLELWYLELFGVFELCGVRSCGVWVVVFALVNQQKYDSFFLHKHHDTITEAYKPSVIFLPDFPFNSVEWKVCWCGSFLFSFSALLL
jgi:hypothetical protein